MRDWQVATPPEPERTDREQPALGHRDHVRVDHTGHVPGAERRDRVGRVKADHMGHVVAGRTDRDTDLNTGPVCTAAL